MARIFLSHSSKNNAEAVALRDWLNGQGWDDLFLDLDPLHGIAAGERWERALYRAADRCEAVLFLVSRAWLESPWCLKEQQLAQKLNKRLFGLLIDDLSVTDLPQELTNAWQVANLSGGSDHVLLHATLPGGDEVNVTFSKAGLERLRAGLVKAGLDPRFFAWPPANDPDRSPYRGLSALGVEDAGIFFGREAAIISGLDRLRGLKEAAPPRALVILGASGAGKSSYLRAGLLARLARDDRSFVALPPLRPERAALSGETGLLRVLEQGLRERRQKVTRAQLKEAVTAGAPALLPLLQSLVEQATSAVLVEGESAPEPPALVFAVDQAEELFQAQAGLEASSLLSLLRELALAEQPKVVLLFTIRSDSFEQLQSAPALEGLPLSTLSLPPMPRGAYQQVIEGPALRLAESGRQLRIEPALTEQLLRDVEAGGGKDALPLIAFTLERLFLEYGGDGDLRLDEYQAIGGIEGSIEAAVERALKAADKDPRVPADREQRLFLLRRALIPWLAGIDPASGAPRRRVARLSEIPLETRALVNHLIEQRLLSTDVAAESGEITVEPAHEALLRQWGLLKGWLAEDFAALTTLEGVQRAARDWAANGKDDAWLAHSGGRLEDAEALLSREDLAAMLSAPEQDYLSRCRQSETLRKDRELRAARELAAANARAKRRTLWGLAVALVLVVLAASAALVASNNAREATENARLAEASAAEALRERERAEEQAEVAAQREREALDSRQQAVLNETVAFASLSRIAWTEGQPVDAVQLALAAWPREGHSDRPQLLRSVQSLNRALPFLLERVRLVGHEDALSSAVFSPDGTRVLTASFDRTARLWDAASGKLVNVLEGHQDWITNAIFSPDGTRALTASADRNARLWDTTTGALLAVLEGHQDWVESAAFSADGTRALTGSADRTATLWDVASGEAIAVLKGHDAAVNSVAFSPDDARLVTASDDGTARVWDAKSGALLAILAGHEEAVVSAVFSPEGTRVLTASYDKTARLWDAESGAPLAVLDGHAAAVLSAAFSPDGKRVLTASADFTVVIWDGATAMPLATLEGHWSGVTSAQFSPDGTRILTASDDGTVRIWSGLDGKELAFLEGHQAEVASAVFSSGGDRVLTASYDGTARLWDVTHVAMSPIVIAADDNYQEALFSPRRHDIADSILGSCRPLGRVKRTIAHQAGRTSRCFLP